MPLDWVFTEVCKYADLPKGNYLIIERGDCLKDGSICSMDFTPENKVGSWANGWNFNNGKFLPASGMRSVADGQLP